MEVVEVGIAEHAGEGAASQEEGGPRTAAQDVRGGVLHRLFRRGARGRRRVLASVSVGALALAGVATTLSGPRPAVADERDDAAQQQQEAADRVNELKSQLEGIDSTLAAVYLELDSLKAKIPTAQSELDAATTKFEAATRQHQVAMDQLVSAEAERTRLEAEVASAREDQRKATEAIAGLAREMYRGDTTSPLTLAMTSQSTQEIGERASAAENLARTQNRTMDEARTSQVTERNKVERQEAVTTRISTLEQKAAQAEQEAADSKAAAQTKLGELTTLKTQADAKAKEWDAKKATARAQLDTWQAEFDQRSAKLAEIDAANRSAGRVYVTSGGMFTSPLPVPLQVTSPFGWRYHPVLGVSKLHNGTDFAAACGTPQYPIAPGVVSAVTNEVAGGNVVYINHGMINGHSWISAHVHLQEVDVSTGQQVDRNTVVGQTGSTGYATGCHLHLSLMMDGADVDPMDYL
ncbi:MAG: peptidoglycan DD-metalloendopeptidase family protein [Actinomyces sp.]|nr:peptidoglycan DD-metalloendopeptidase family protein [Actinomyces sp.]